MPTPPKKIAIKTFVANMDMASCLEFSEGYLKIVSDQGIKSEFLRKHNWVQAEGIYGVLALHESSIIGGVILFIPNEQDRFPYEDLTGIPKKGKKKPLQSQPAGTGELFALWHASHVSGWGVSYILLKAGLALSVKLGLKKTLYLAAEFNINLINKLGFQPEIKDDSPVKFTFQENSLRTTISLNCFYTDELMVANQIKMEINELAQTRHIQILESVLGKSLDIEYNI